MLSKRLRQLRGTVRHQLSSPRTGLFFWKFDLVHPVTFSTTKVINLVSYFLRHKLSVSLDEYAYDIPNAVDVS